MMAVLLFVVQYTMLIETVHKMQFVLGNFLDFASYFDDEK